MKYKTIRVSLIALLLSFPLVAGVTGRWTASVQARNNNTRNVTLNLKEDGDKLTGTIGAGRRQIEIKDGRVDGDSISFSTITNRNGNDVKVNYTGKLAGDELKLTRGREGGRRTATFTAKRVE